MDLTDSEILEILRNDEQAHTCIYIQYKDYCLNYMVGKMGIDREDALDLYQEATIVLYQNVKRGDFELKCTIRTYLCAICKNQCLNIRKSNYNSKIFLSDEIDENITDWYDEHTEEQNRKISLIIEQLNELKSKNYECYERIQAFYYDKLSLEDITNKFGFKNVNSAKEQLSKCRKKIKQKLGV